MTAGTVAGLKPCPAYKPSGVEWLGEVQFLQTKFAYYQLEVLAGERPYGSVQESVSGQLRLLRSDLRSGDCLRNSNDELRRGDRR